MNTNRLRLLLSLCLSTVVLRGGSMPLDVLAQEVDAWVTAKKAGG